MTTQADRVDSLLLLARKHFEAKNLATAEEAYRGLLDIAPGHIEAANFCAVRALSAGLPGEAIRILHAALLVDPHAYATRQHMGVALHIAGDHEAASRWLGDLLHDQPSLYLARFHLGAALEARGHFQEAVAAYFGAINAAQRQGKWLSPDAIPMNLRKQVLHAMGVVNKGRLGYFNSLMEPLKERFGSQALSRVQTALECYLGDRDTVYADADQRPTFLYFPGLSTRAVHPSDTFPWVDELQSKTSEIRGELQAILAQPDGVRPFNSYRSEEEEARYLKGNAGSPKWNAFFLYRHGQIDADNAARCPFTVQALERLPLVKIRAHAPEVCFSMLTSGTHILKHRGVTNTRLVAHLPLIVPEGNCALRVADQSYQWHEGKVFIFDDCFEHEAWNRTPSMRAILLLDFWHPGLTECERLAVSELVAGIGDFNASAGMPTESN